MAFKALAFRGIERFCVLYLKGGREHRTGWFYSRQRAEAARELMARKFGSAIIFAD